MTTVHVSQERARRLRRRRREKSGQLLLPLSIFATVAVLAFIYIGYVLWPRWPTPRLDAPALPIMVAGVAFNLPPAAIRVPVQRRPGAQERVDLAFLWPSLEPPDPNAKPPASTTATAPETSPAFARVFMTIAAAGDTPGPGGLTVVAFRAGTPYQGEDLIYDDPAPSFFVRCTRNRAGPMPGICLYERRIDAADVVVRFPRDWLRDWRMVADNLDRLIVSLRVPR